MDAKDIDKHLRNNFKHAKYLVSNIYCFNPYCGESDLLVIGQNGYASEFEIKVSRADFKKEFTKEKKHLILSEGIYTDSWSKEINQTNDRPNKFWFATPVNLIKAEEVPDYAGLLYVHENGSIEKIKEAKFIHKEKLNFTEKLCNKFYFAYEELRAYKNNDKIKSLQKNNKTEE